MSGGGKGANQALAAAKAGGAVSFVARVGRDDLGWRALGDFRLAGLDVRHVVMDREAASGVALICVSGDGENQIVVASGANARLSLSDVKKSTPVLRQAGIALAQLEIPLETVLFIARLARKSKVPFLLNPAPARALPEELLQCVSLITPNETECEILTGIRVRDERSMKKAAAALRAQGAQAVVITLGRRGAFLDSEEGSALIKGFDVSPRDTTGAGDVFNGALAVALAEGRPLSEAVRFGNAAAAISVTRPGAQTSSPSRQEIEQRL